VVLITYSYNNFRSGSNNLFLQSGTNSLRSGSNNVFVTRGQNGIISGSNNVLIGNIGTVVGPTGGTIDNYFGISAANVEGLITKYDSDPLRIKSNTTVTGSMLISGSATVTGSLQGNIETITFSSNTGSLDFGNAVFFQATGQNGNNWLNASNLKPGQRSTIKLISAGGSTQYIFSNTYLDSSLIGSNTISVTSGYRIVDMVTYDGSNVLLLNVYVF